MKTWFDLWPLLLVPAVVLFLPALLPHVSSADLPLALPAMDLGGDLYRQWWVNATVLPWLPLDWARRLVAWYQATHAAGELALHALICLNVNAALLPLLVLLGEVRIRAASWRHTTALKHKRRLAQHQR